MEKTNGNSFGAKRLGRRDSSCAVFHFLRATFLWETRLKSTRTSFFGKLSAAPVKLPSGFGSVDPLLRLGRNSCKDLARSGRRWNGLPRIFSRLVSRRLTRSVWWIICIHWSNKD